MAKTIRDLTVQQRSGILQTTGPNPRSFTKSPVSETTLCTLLIYALGRARKHSMCLPIHTSAPRLRNNSHASGGRRNETPYWIFSAAVLGLLGPIRITHGWGIVKNDLSNIHFCQPPSSVSISFQHSYQLR